LKISYVKLYKNHHYESVDLLKDNNYLTLFALVEELSFVYKYTHKVKNSYDFINIFDDFNELLYSKRNDKI